MYASVPSKLATTPSLNGNQLTFDVFENDSAVPAKQKVFLEKLGWTTACYHAGTNEQLFWKMPPANCTDEIRNSWAHDLRHNYWHWYEAVAYEFTKFMGIEDDSGENPSMGSAGMGSVQTPSQQSK